MTHPGTLCKFSQLLRLRKQETRSIKTSRCFHRNDDDWATDANYVIVTGQNVSKRWPPRKRKRFPIKPCHGAISSVMHPGIAAMFLNQCYMAARSLSLYVMNARYSGRMRETARGCHLVRVTMFHSSPATWLPPSSISLSSMSLSFHSPRFPFTPYISVPSVRTCFPTSLFLPPKCDGRWANQWLTKQEHSRSEDMT